jgi:hypothetical protein
MRPFVTKREIFVGFNRQKLLRLAYNNSVKLCYIYTPDGIWAKTTQKKSLLSPGGANYSLPKLLLRGPVDGPAIVTIVTKKKREE